MLAYAKMYAALIGTIATALLNEYGPHGNVGVALTVVAIVATAVTTWAVPNVPNASRKRRRHVDLDNLTEG